MEMYMLYLGSTKGWNWSWHWKAES